MIGALFGGLPTLTAGTWRFLRVAAALLAALGVVVAVVSWIEHAAVLEDRANRAQQAQAETERVREWVNDKRETADWRDALPDLGAERLQLMGGEGGEHQSGGGGADADSAGDAP
jgi:transcriptional regulator of nitric oxide reductase